MYYKEFGGINSFLVGMAQILLKESVKRETRGFKCYEIPNPVIMKITNPFSRLVVLPQRKWNYILPYVESLWLASGRNDMELVGNYVKKLYDFSDDMQYMRAGYGPRLRFFNGVPEDYKAGYDQKHMQDKPSISREIDQFEFIEKCFNKDMNTRQAIITIGDPAKDCFEPVHELKKTKDFPCTRSLQFIKNNDSLDMIVHMRSNDFVWGATGVNIFNFTFMQEYFAHILGLEVGSYYHIANNLHYYDDMKEMVEKIADSGSDVDDNYHKYKRTIRNLADFDRKLKDLQDYEKKIRTKETSDICDLGDDFFNDWAKVLYVANTSKAIDFANPVLNDITKKKLTSQSRKENTEQFRKTFGKNDNNDDIEPISTNYI